MHPTPIPATFTPLTIDTAVFAPLSPPLVTLAM
jgi:hypothetical protein